MYGMQMCLIRCVGNHTTVRLVLLLLLSCIVTLHADNPLVRHIFTADPAPLVYNDTFYIFTGHDEGGNNTWTLNGWHVLSSVDMVNWTDHGEVLGVADVTWLNAHQAWAAQCIERDGMFYFYICDSGEIGVAVADHVLGPYNDALGKPLISNQTPGACPGDDNIDPTVFIDDDGNAYIYWGTDRVVRQAKLKDNMIELDGEITVPQGVDRFFEASWVHKKDDIYYYSYAAYNASGKNWPSNIDYATSANPLGPWEYQGTLNGYAGTGTNHPGIIEFKGQWYFVYHTDYLSDGEPWKRSVQINYLYYNNDGTMKKIIQDTVGVESIGRPLFSEDVWYKIKALHSGKLLDVEGESKNNDANVYQNSDNGAFSQQWKIVEVERGVYEIVNRNSSLSLDADQSNDNVLQYESRGGADQRWKITGAGNGGYYIVNKSNNRMLEVYYAESDDGANVQHWGFNGETCQMWNIVPADSQKVKAALSLKNCEMDNGKNYRCGVVQLSGTAEQLLPYDIRLDLKGRVVNRNCRGFAGDGFYLIPKSARSDR